MNNFEKRLNKLLDEAPMTVPAPVRTPTRRKEQPQPSPKRKPWNPPKPKHVPAPKNKKLHEDYDSEVHGTTRDFWKDLPSNNHHAFGRHPLMAMHGDSLSRAAYGHSADRARESEGDPQALVPQIFRLEQPHAAELVALSKKMTVKIWGIPEGMLDANLTSDVDPNEDSDEDYGAEQPRGREHSEDEVLQQVNKRLTLNTMTQGAGVHAMLTLQDHVETEIGNISPQLLSLYKSLSAGAHKAYWLWNIPQMFGNLSNMAVGSARVEYGDEDEEEAGVEPSTKVVARAVMFPVLVQELSKGVAELISHFGLQDLDAEMTQKVLAKADDIRHEPYLIQVGPQLWRQFQDLIPSGSSRADILQALSMQPPADVQKIVMAVVEDPEHARELISELVAEEEDFEIDEWQPEPDDDWQSQSSDDDWREDISKIADFLSEDINGSS